ncbi:MAG: sulfurtransferase-like selenium metabolism protein YedF [Campylobacterota bacterium]
MQRYDVRGLECPQPVIVTKDALSACNEVFVVESDSAIAKENISKFLNKNGVNFAIDSKDDIYFITVTPKEIATDEAVTCAQNSVGKVILFTSDTIGGDKILGEKLAKGFLQTLTKIEKRPSHIFLINSAVKLSTNDTQAVEVLQQLQKLGVGVYSCGLCLEYYGLENALKVGQVGNALDTLGALLDATNSVTLG